MKSLKNSKIKIQKIIKTKIFLIKKIYSMKNFKSKEDSKNPTLFNLWETLLKIIICFLKCLMIKFLKKIKNMRKIIIKIKKILKKPLTKISQIEKKKKINYKIFFIKFFHFLIIYIYLNFYNNNKFNTESTSFFYKKFKP
jgi:hypothetical protein